LPQSVIKQRSKLKGKVRVEKKGKVRVEEKGGRKGTLEGL
jgi:hypothetical protein